MIPKIIHYCWFGPNQLSDEAKKNIETWKKHCPDYEIKRWSEDTFDITQNAYVKEAYENRKFAFVTDYVRLYALYHFGGIYMDTDVEVCRNMDALLVYPAFSGYESDAKIPTGTMAAEKENSWIKLLLDDYRDIHFVRSNGTMDITTNTERITQTTLKNYSVVLNGKTIEEKDFVMLPFDYLCAKQWDTDEVVRTENTYTIHHFANSWQSEKMRAYGRFRRNVKKSKNPIMKLLDKCLNLAVEIVKR